MTGRATPESAARPTRVSRRELLAAGAVAAGCICLGLGSRTFGGAPPTAGG